jgi:hypothetical protein
VNILTTSREWLIVPAGELAHSRPLRDQVDIAPMPIDIGAEPGAGDWWPASWLAGAAGQVLGAGVLVGPGGGRVIAAGLYTVWCREHPPDGEAPVWRFRRLTAGLP